MKTYRISDGIELPYPFQWYDTWDGQTLTTLDALEIRIQQLRTLAEHPPPAEADPHTHDQHATDRLELEQLEANLDHLINQYHTNLVNNHDVTRTHKAMAQATRIVLWQPDLQPDTSDGNLEFELSSGDYIFDLPDHIESLWGDGEQILWARGEPLMIYGPTGIGKTTVARQLVLTLIGINPPNLLNYPITPLPPDKTFLYVAADRPRQAMRSLKRMVQPHHRPQLAQHLRIEHHRQIWTPQTDHTLLWRACQQANAGAVLLDSTKDVADGPLKEEPTAKAFMDNIQVCIANNVDVLMLHHPRKNPRDATTETNIDGVYGSTWLTAGSGSVLLVNGQPGAGTITISQLKAPATFIPDITATINYETGHLERRNVTDLIDWMEASYPNAITIREAVAWKTQTAVGDIGTNDKEYKDVARQLRKAIEQGRILLLDRQKTGANLYQWAPPTELNIEGIL